MPQLAPHQLEDVRRALQDLVHELVEVVMSEEEEDRIDAVEFNSLTDYRVRAVLTRIADAGVSL